MKRPSQQDRSEIEDLISTYSHTLDGKDAESWGRLFTEKATIRVVFRSGDSQFFASHGERMSFIQAFYDFADENGLVRSRHFQTNTLLECQADGSVTGSTLFSVSHQYDDGPPQVRNTGVYRDRFEKTPAGWKLSERHVEVDQ